MRYFKCTWCNGFWSCEEDFYYTAKDEKAAENIAEDYREDYDFSEPNESFCDMDDEDAIEGYYEGLYFYVEEITKEDFEDYA